MDHFEWEMEDPGWYICLSEKVGIAKERDGMWHVYIVRDMPPGDSKHKTLREAKAWAEAVKRPRKESKR